ncbi:MAG: GNAT family N-acetyltransferase [Acidimicrobiales bacterium]
MITAGDEEPLLLVEAVRRFRGSGDAPAFLATPGSVSYVATDGSEVVGWCWGYVMVRPDASSMAYLHELEVATSHQGRGVGRELTTAFMRAASRAGAGRMFLSTAADNHRARALYESLGGGLAEQGPTVSYWFRLDGVGASGTRADDRAMAEYFLLGAETAATLLGHPELAERWDQLSALAGFTVGQLAGHFVRAVGVTNAALARGEAEEDPIASLPAWYSGRIDSWSDRTDEIRSSASGEATLGPQVCRPDTRPLCPSAGTCWDRLRRIRSEFREATY